MKWKKFVVILFASLFLLALLIYEGNVYCYNRNLEKNFTPNWEIPLYSPIWKGLYEEKPVPDWYLRREEITEKEMGIYYVAMDMYPDLGYNPPVFDTFTLEQDLHYYSKPDVHSEVKIIKKGTLVYVAAFRALLDFFSKEENKAERKAEALDLISGPHTFPSYDKNWRLAIPYFTVEELDHLKHSELPEIKAYYLPLKELQASIKTYQKQYEQFCKKEGMKPFSYRGMKPYSQYFYIDSLLYRYGCYLSPNLYKPFYTKWIGLGIGLAGIFLIGIFVLRKNRLKKIQEDNRIKGM